ncbi:MAG: hypothetical protein LBR64_06945 [Dysgonamonadaceae bacterium]|jgi:hypothetical protein|nr:hypothetical protein [Dysgonamonadaceae bacterium]
MRRFLHHGGHLVLGIAAIAGLTAIGMLLWNWLLPDIFGLTKINFWQTLGLLALARLFFGGMGTPFWMSKHEHHRSGVLREKWQKMTPDERREFLKKRHSMRGFPQDFPHDFHDGREPERQD